MLYSGVVEGLNNKAKVTMRKSSGFRTFRCLELALYQIDGIMPEKPCPNHIGHRRGTQGRPVAAVRLLHGVNR